MTRVTVFATVAGLGRRQHTITADTRDAAIARFRAAYPDRQVSDVKVLDPETRLPAFIGRRDVDVEQVRLLAAAVTQRRGQA